MAILELALTAYGIVGTTASVVGGIDLALKRFSKITAEKLFKKCLDDTVKECASSLVGFTETRNPKTISVDPNKFDSVVASLKNTDVTELRLLEECERLTKITDLFRECITLPYHKLTDKDLEQKLRPVFEKTIINFYGQLPFEQEAFNQIALGFIQNSTTNQADAQVLLSDLLKKIEHVQVEVQERLTENIQDIKDNTDKMKKTTRAALDVNLEVLGKVTELTDSLNRHLSISIPDVVAEERQSTINIAKDLLETYQPETALKLLGAQKKRVWASASEDLKFNILTNMAAAQFALNNEQETADLIIEAFQYKPEEEKALANRALAHLLLGEIEKAIDYAEQTLQKNPDNADAHIILIETSASEVTLEEIIDKVPKHLREIPQIAYAISNIAKQHGNLEDARKWREIMVAQEQENAPDSKAALAAILIEQALADQLTMVAKQFDKTQKEQLRQAIDLLTEAWDCISRTELRDFRVDWIINRSMAHFHLGQMKEAIKDLDTALEIEPLNPDLLKKRAISAFQVGERESAIEFLEKIQPNSEVPEVPIMLANFLFTGNRFAEAIAKLNDFLSTNPSSELKDEANRWLVRIYIATKRFEEAERILTTLQESSPTNLLNFINAAQIANGTEKREEAISFLKDAYEIAKNCKASIEIVELADELFDHKQFIEAATLYEKLADTRQNSQLTIGLLASYDNAGEIGKALEICQELRKRYGPLENISEREIIIYEEIGDMNQAEVVCKAYLNKFPNDIDRQIRLGLIYYRSNKEEEIDNILDSFSDFKNFSFLKNLSLEACAQLALLHQVRSQPEKALQVMYETRRTRFDNRDAHLQYIRLFYEVDKQIPEVLNPVQVQVDTAVQIDSSDQPIWYIIVDYDDIDITRSELDINDTFAKRLLGKRVGDEVNLGKTPLGQKIGKISDIKSKYVYAVQESLQKFEEFFRDDEGLWSIKLDEFSDNLKDQSSNTTDSTNIQPILELTNKQHEASLEIENVYKEHLPPIGVFMNWTGRNVLDVWNLLINKPDLGIRCFVGSAKEKSQALNLLKEPKPKLVVDIISLITLHCLEAADTVVKTFGKLAVAQSTIDGLLQIIHEQESMWSQREGMSIEKQGNRYVRHMINPEDVKRSVERLKDLIKWIRVNCDVLPCTPALQMNQLRKRKLDEMFHPIFVDTLLIAAQSGHLLLSDDERLRVYAKTNFNSEAGTNFQIDGVWTQVILEHCLNLNVLDKAQYDKMAIQLVCSNYYHTEFDTDVLMEALKQANWNLAEPYNSLVQALREPKMSLQEALNVSVDFLFKIWEEPIPYNQMKFVTLGLLAGLTSGRNTHEVLNQLEYLIQNKHALFFPIENRILRQIQVYEQLYPFERNFEFLSDDDIRIKGTRVSIESVLYESLHLSQTPEEIVQHFHTLTLELVYATILYYLQNPVKVGNYLANNVKYSQMLRKEYEKNPPPGVVRLRQLKAEKQTKS